MMSSASETRMYVNGMGFRAVERVTGINPNTIINWVRLAGNALADAPQAAEIPEITELDELQTVRLNSRPKPLLEQKKNKFWLWTAVNHKALLYTSLGSG